MRHSSRSKHVTPPKLQSRHVLWSTFVWVSSHVDLNHLHQKVICLFFSFDQLYFSWATQLWQWSKIMRNMDYQAFKKNLRLFWTPCSVTDYLPSPTLTYNQADTYTRSCRAGWCTRRPRRTGSPCTRPRPRTNPPRTQTPSCIQIILHTYIICICIYDIIQ